MFSACDFVCEDVHTLRHVRTNSMCGAHRVDTEFLIPMGAYKITIWNATWPILDDNPICLVLQQMHRTCLTQNGDDGAGLWSSH